MKKSTAVEISLSLRIPNTEYWIPNTEYTIPNTVVFKYIQCMLFVVYIIINITFMKRSATNPKPWIYFYIFTSHLVHIINDFGLSWFVKQMCRSLIRVINNVFSFVMYELPHLQTYLHSRGFIVLRHPHIFCGRRVFISQERKVVFYNGFEICSKEKFFD